MFDWLMSRCKRHPGGSIRYPPAASLLIEPVHWIQECWSSFSNAATWPGLQCSLAPQYEDFYETKPHSMPGTAVAKVNAANIMRLNEFLQ
jgi:hypothetical protein